MFGKGPRPDKLTRRSYVSNTECVMGIDSQQYYADLNCSDKCYDVSICVAKHILIFDRYLSHRTNFRNERINEIK